MSIQEESKNNPDAPVDLTESTANKPSSPVDLTEQGASNPDSPQSVTEQAESKPDAPANLTEQNASKPAAPTNTTEVAVDKPDAPANLTEQAESKPAAPQSVTEIADSSPSAPLSLTEVAKAGINRTLTPLVNLDFAGENYSLNGIMGALTDVVNYSRSSSASYIETFKNDLGETDKRLTVDYVGNVTNLALHSSNLQNAYWAKGSSSVEKASIKTPDGSQAFKLIDNSTSSVHTLTSGVITVNNNSIFTMSCMVKAGTLSVIGLYDIISQNGVSYDIKLGKRIQTINDSTIHVRYISDGWYRLSVTQISDGTSPQFRLYLNTFSGYVGEGGFLYVSEMQVTQSSDPLPYVETLSTAVTKAFTANPRIEVEGFLSEGAKTNVVPNSQNFTASNWGTNGCTIVANSTLAPDGSFTGSLLYPDSTGSNRNLNDAIVGTTDTYCSSFYIKSAGYRWVRVVGPDSTGGVWFDIINGVIGASASNSSGIIQDVGNGWFRCGVVASNSAANVISYLIMVDEDNGSIVTADGQKGLYVWGAQLEANFTMSSYIKTESSAVTRAREDTVSYINPTKEYTFLISSDYNGGSEISSGGRVSGSIETTTGTNRFIFFNTGNTNNSGRIDVDNNAVQAFISPITSSKEIGTGVITFSGSEYNYYHNGNLVQTAQISDAPQELMNQVWVGSSKNGGNPLTGNVSKVQVYNKALTANEVKAL